MKVLSDAITLSELIELSLELQFFRRKSSDDQIESVVFLRQLANLDVEFIADIFEIDILRKLLSELKVFVSKFADSLFSDDSNLLIQTGIVVSQYCVSVFQCGNSSNAAIFV